MKRRQLIGYSLTGAATTAALAACNSTGPAISEGSLPRITWQMTISWPTSLDTLYGAAQYLAQRVSDMTNGRFTITVFEAGALVPPLQVLDAVQAGTVQCGHTASYYYSGKNPAFVFGTGVPFGLNAQQQNAWLYHGGGNEAMNEIYGQFNVIAFPGGNSGAQMGGWFKREINRVSDLNGLKMRIPGIGGEVLARLGVNVQVLPGSEVFLGLDRGAIDAAEWVGPFDDEKLGLNKAAQFYYYPGWWETGSSFDFLVNLDAWNQLPAEYQAILKSAAADTNVTCLAKYDSVNPPALLRLLESGTQLRPFSREILEAGQKATFELLEEKANSNADFKKVYESWKKFREEIYQWHAVNEVSYSNFAIGPLLP